MVCLHLTIDEDHNYAKSDLCEEFGRLVIGSLCLPKLKCIYNLNVDDYLGEI